MNEKDKQIQDLFDGYADSLEPRTELSELARAKMERSERTRARRKNMRRRTIRIALSCAAGAAVVAVFGLGVLPRLLKGGNTSTPPTENGASGSDTNITRYDITNVRAIKVTAEAAEELIDLTALKNAEEVFYEQYYACYLKDSDELVYIRAILGVATDDGAVEMNIVAEKDGYCRNDLDERFGYLTNYDFNYRYDYYNGEYITAAYIKAQELDVHYYVIMMGNQQYSPQILENLL